MIFSFSSMRLGILTLAKKPKVITGNIFFFGLLFSPFLKKNSKSRIHYSKLKTCKQTSLLFCSNKNIVMVISYFRLLFDFSFIYVKPKVHSLCLCLSLQLLHFTPWKHGLSFIPYGNTDYLIYSIQHKYMKI